MRTRRSPWVCLAAIIGLLCLLPPAPAAQAPAAPQTSPAQPPGSKPYRILVTNDDGIRAPGIVALAEALEPLGEITVVAPSENQTGKGHSIITSDPILVDEVTFAGAVRAYSVVGPPATCVKVGVRALMSGRPDLVVAGINHGFNVGMVTYVSGTVGAAREAALMGIPAIASSLPAEEPNYAPGALLVRQLAQVVQKNGLPPGVLLNLNIPAGAGFDIKGMQMSRQSASSGDEQFEEQKSPSGRRLFWSVWKEPTGGPEGTDVWATEHGFAAVTPLRAGEFDAQTFEAWKGKLPR